jgi:DNA polymerase elongation subunit (family B)
MTESNIYTNIRQYGNDLLYIGYENSERVQKRIQYEPHLFVDSENDTGYTNIYNQNIEKVEFDSINATKDFISNYGSAKNFNLYGIDKFNYQYISENYPTEITFDKNVVKIYFFDIEVYSPDEFPTHENAVHEITAISIKDKKNNQMHVWYLDSDYGKFDPDNLKHIKNPTYEIVPHEFTNEKDLLHNFIMWFSSNPPDILSGWYSRLFDIPYLYNRLVNVFSKKVANRLSPWNMVKEKRKQVKRNNSYHEEVSYDIYGINEIDYMDLYQKYSINKSETYKLDFIANKHLGVGKLEYEGTLNQLLFNDYQTYVEYNIIDVQRIDELEDSLLYLELLMIVSYAAKVATYNDALGTVKYWEILIYNFLCEQNKRPEIKRFNDSTKTEKYDGAFVKEPIPGMKEWVVSFDYTSLYPSIIRQVNIGPETQLKPDPFGGNILTLANSVEIPKFLNYEYDLSELKTYNMSMAANGTYYKRDVQSFLSSLMETFFKKRKEYQAIMRKYDRQLSTMKKTDKDYDKIHTLKKQYDTKQYAVKILINSAYGAVGNAHFQYYAVDNAEAVTLTGQLIIQNAERSINEYLNKLLSTDNIDYVTYIDTDSVGADTEVWLNDKKIPIEQLYNELEGIVEYRGKDNEIKHISDNVTTKTYYDSNVVDRKINYVMRHKVKKMMYKISVDDKYVIVTEDHSVMVERDGSLIAVTPSEILETDLVIHIV